MVTQPVIVFAKLQGYKKAECEFPPQKKFPPNIKLEKKDEGKTKDTATY